MNYKHILIFALPLLLLACSQNDNVNDFDEGAEPEKSYSEKLQDIAPQTFTEILMNFENGESNINAKFNDFGKRFLVEINADVDPNDNLMCSPVSATVTTMMMASAADDVMRNQVLNAFGTTDFDALTLLTAKINRSLNYQRNGMFLCNANSVWVDHSRQPSSEYTDLMSDIFVASVEQIDMFDTAAADVINKWVSDNTNGMINGIFAPGALEKDVIWANALFLEGEWESKFDKTLTKREIFHGTKGDSEVDMMHQTIVGASSDYIDGYIVVKLPVGNYVSVVMVLPPEGTDINKALQDFTLDIFDRASFGKVTADLAIPKFNVNSELKLNSAFRKLGIDLEGTYALPGLGISDSGSSVIEQKASINIDEDGATAAVVTFDQWGTAWPSEIENIKVEFNRPFLYYVQASGTQTVLFGGKIANL